MSWMILIPAISCAPIDEDRVARARTNVEPSVKALCQTRGISYPPARLFLRGFKQEAALEVWASDGGAKMTLLKTYRVAKQSGGPGPKRREGDRQVPEGFYVIDRFNAKSKFHLSLGIDYPNASDRIRSDPAKPGSDIFIHGSDQSIGCLAMTDPVIEEIYLLALGARKSEIPVHLFPARMSGSGYRALRRANPALGEFWDELEPIYRKFEDTRVVPRVKVSKSGAYSL